MWTAADLTDAMAGAARHLAAQILNGATLWCTSPGLDDHARHLAVEFVHPASVGAHAVAAVAITALGPPALIDRLRRSCRVGDVVISLGDAEVELVGELGARTPAWGASHMHVGWSETATVAAMHPDTSFLRVGVDHRAERHLTRAYHLLWELTFISMQSLPTSTPPQTASPLTTSCAVCGDEALVGEVQQLVTADVARVRSACGTTDVDVSLIDAVRPYDLVLVHARTALRRLPLGPST